MHACHRSYLHGVQLLRVQATNLTLVAAISCGGAPVYAENVTANPLQCEQDSRSEMFCSTFHRRLGAGDLHKVREAPRRAKLKIYGPSHSCNQ